MNNILDVHKNTNLVSHKSKYAYLWQTGKGVIVSESSYANGRALLLNQANLQSCPLKEKRNHCCIVLILLKLFFVEICI